MFKWFWTIFSLGAPVTTAQDYLDGFMEESKEELDTDETLSGEDSDSLTENEEYGD